MEVVVVGYIKVWQWRRDGMDSGKLQVIEVVSWRWYGGVGGVSVASLDVCGVGCGCGRGGWKSTSRLCWGITILGYYLFPSLHNKVPISPSPRFSLFSHHHLFLTTPTTTVLRSVHHTHTHTHIRFSLKIHLIFTLTTLSSPAT